MNSVLAQLTDGHSLLQVVLEGTLIGQLVLVSLLLLSSLSWAVIILKGLQFYRFQKDDQNFLLLFRESSLDQTYKQIESFPQSSLAYISVKLTKRSIIHIVAFKNQVPNIAKQQ